MTPEELSLALSLFAIPLLIVVIDTTGQFIARRRTINVVQITAATPRCTDYTIIVPIWGNIAYLENVEFLRQYGERVLLTTSASQTPEFFAELWRIADENNFRTFISAEPAQATDGGNRRQTGGTIRDTVVRAAHCSITSRYVVCIDADSESEVSLDYLIGAVDEAGLDVASVRLVPSNRNTLLARLQGHEYSMAMRMRRLMPWMVSGGCHVARREVHDDLMQRHSLFFQGQDVELGLLASARGYRIGHILFDVQTAVPANFKSWWRQRKAWAGGEFRLTVLNIHLAWRHPWLYFYGFLVLFVLLPGRWYYLIHPAWSLAIMFVMYLVTVTIVNWERRDRTLLVYPLYSCIYTLVLIPLGICNYFWTAAKHRNAGIIRPGRVRTGIRAAAADEEVMASGTTDHAMASSSDEPAWSMPSADIVPSFRRSVRARRRRRSRLPGTTRISRGVRRSRRHAPSPAARLIALLDAYDASVDFEKVSAGSTRELDLTVLSGLADDAWIAVEASAA